MAHEVDWLSYHYRLLIDVVLLAADREPQCAQVVARWDLKPGKAEIAKEAGMQMMHDLIAAVSEIAAPTADEIALVQAHQALISRLAPQAAPEPLIQIATR